MADTPKLPRVHREIAAALERIARMFVPSARLTLIVRIPEMPDGTVIVGNDSTDDVIAAIRRVEADNA